MNLLPFCRFKWRDNSFYPGWVQAVSVALVALPHQVRGGEQGWGGSLPNDSLVPLSLRKLDIVKWSSSIT